MRLLLISAVAAAAVAAACAKPMVTATAKGDINYIGRDYAASANDIYYAARWALFRAGYAVASENLQDGILTTSWRPVTSDSHYIPLFGGRDYGVTNSYHQLEVRIEPGEGRTAVKVGSRVKGLVSSIASSGIEEEKVLDGIGDYLRKAEPAVTNLGIEE